MCSEAVGGGRLTRALCPCLVYVQEVFTTLLSKYRETCNDSMVLNHILTCFSARLYDSHARCGSGTAPWLTRVPACLCHSYAQHARSMVALINEADVSITPQARVRVAPSPPH